ncbi:monovalent cation/H(+) antiporter subunit G [Halomicrococcus sp. SG-WS-1]|uniref:monovalent cation/H(+) antiporter subunit G n=1 Tax=Halomicrococcus sp. SG-WS-1 TaxID=3439057 RepID=UPI003F7960F2
MTPADLAATLAAGGVFFVAVGAVGLVRLPDCFARAHATSKSETLGALLTLAAVGVAVPADARPRVAVLAVVVLVTSPVATHAIVRTAREAGVEPWMRQEGEEP